MGVLTDSRDTKAWTGGAKPSMFSAPMGVDIGYQGGLAAINTSGYAVAPTATPDSTLKIVGIFEETCDNSGGSAGDLTAKIKKGVFRFANSGSTGAITDADIGRPCYVVDDQTVSRLSAMGIRPVAGRVAGVDSAGVWVEVGDLVDEHGNVDLLVVAGSDLSEAQYLAVALASDSAVDLVGAAGADALGILQNAPAAAAVAIVRIQGITKWIASGSINPGVRLASSTTTGKSKAAVAATVDTSDTASASDAVVGSYVLGIALTAGVQDAAHDVLLQPMGAIPTTAA